MTVCNVCGTENKETAKFCLKCGHKLEKKQEIKENQCNEEKEANISKEKISKHYQQVKNVITSSLKENDFVSDKKDESEFLQGIKTKLESINATFKKEIEELEEIADWENLCISFFGETNAGKSTIIDTLRIIYNEESRLADIIENQKEVESFFNQNNETYSNLVCAINQFKSFTKEFYEYLQNEENQLKQRKNDLEKDYEELNKKHNIEYEQKVSEFQQEKKKEMLEIENKRKDLEKEYEELTIKHNTEYEQKVSEFQQEKQKGMLEIENKRKDLEKCTQEKLLEIEDERKKLEQETNLLNYEFKESQYKFYDKINKKEKELLDLQHQKEKEFQEYRDDYEKLKNFYRKKRFSVKTLFVIAILFGFIGAGVYILLQNFM